MKIIAKHVNIGKYRKEYFLIPFLPIQLGLFSNITIYVTCPKNPRTGTNKIIYHLLEIIYVFLTIFLYLLKCPQSLILSALRAFCFCGKPHISRSIFLYFPCQSWLKSW